MDIYVRVPACLPEHELSGADFFEVWIGKRVSSFKENALEAERIRAAVRGGAKLRHLCFSPLDHLFLFLSASLVWDVFLTDLGKGRALQVEMLHGARKSPLYYSS